METVHVPNPEVYRKAAKLIEENICKFSCYAISSITLQLRYPADIRNKYVKQYAALFSNDKEVGYIDSYGFIRGKTKVRTHLHTRSHYQYITVSENHPYWNRPSTPARQKMRVLALLLMADIVEQSCCT